MEPNLEYMQVQLWESSYFHPHLYQEHHPFFSIAKGGLISESLSVGMFSQKIFQIIILNFFSLISKVEDSDLAQFLEQTDQDKKHSEIKPPLANELQQLVQC